LSSLLAQRLRRKLSIFPVRPLLTVRFSNESAGIADLITTCYKTGQPFEVIEKKLLNGQKLQGTLTAEEVNRFLVARRRTKGYPLFEKVYKIAFEGMPVKELVQGL
jgi:glycerol-3-phosphate dehydrogenase (NAD+)